MNESWLICLFLGSGWLVAGAVGLLYFASKLDWDAEKERYDYTIKELIKVYVGVDIEKDVDGTESGGSDGKGEKKKPRRRRVYFSHKDSLMIPIKDKVDAAIRGWDIPKG